MLRVRVSAFFLALAVVAILAIGVVQAGDDWLPITPEELAMKDYSPSPGSHAVLLYKEVATDDMNSYEKQYYRIKIFSEEGKKYANVEIPYVQRFNRVGDIKARTIRPDGSIVNFEGQVFDKVVLKSRGLKVHVKSFSLPDVQVGSIIEYKFTVRWDSNQAYSPRWEVQDTLPTRRARFSFTPYPRYAVSWTAFLPPGVAVWEGKNRMFELTAESVPGFPEEEYMPPESSLKMRVEFFYFFRAPESAEKFWKEEGKQWYDVSEQFIGKRRGIQETVAQLVAPDDPPETKVRKIYARVQQIRNLSYERARSEKEQKSENLKENNNVEDVLKRGYGYRTQINRLFAAMARATGLEATIIRLSERDVQFFRENLLNWRQLDGEVTLVRVGNEERYLDSGTPHCPFGMLPWLRTGVKGIRLNKEGGVFITTPQPVSANAIVERKGTLQVDEEGTLKGKVQVSFIGMEAVSRRLDTMDDDETGRRKELEDEIKGWLPSTATVKLENVTGWTGFEEPLKVEFSMEIPGFASSAGRRMLLPAGIFQSDEAHPFRHANRVHPIYFRNPFREMDDLTVQLPAGYKVESVPAPKKIAPEYAKYEISRTQASGALRLQRSLIVDAFYFPVEYYSSLRTFFNNVRAGDEEQVVLQVAAGQPK